MRSTCAVFTAAVALAASALVVQSAETAPPPIVMPTVNVMESALKIKVTISYRRFKMGPPFVTGMTVDTVKPGSFAEQAGLKTGMEILAIQGTPVANLTQGEVERLLQQPAHGSVVVRIRRGWLKSPEDIRITVPVE
jgi:S1-C subfamily serine protease